MCSTTVSAERAKEARKTLFYVNRLVENSQAQSLRSAGWIAAWQLIASLVWIYASDYVLARLVHDPTSLTHYQSLKGTFFVVFLAALTFFLVRRRVQALILARDAQARIAQKLARADQIRKLGYDAAELGSWHIDWATKTIYCDARSSKHLGIRSGTPAECLLKDLHLHDKEAAMAAAFKINQGQNPKPVEYRFRNSDSSWRWIAISSLLLKSDDSTILVGITHDITTSKTAQITLASNETLLRTVTQNAEVGLALIDEQRKLTFFNDRFQELLGLRSDLAANQHGCLPSNVRDHIDPWLERAFSGDRVTFEMSLASEELRGEVRYFRVTFDPRADESGAIKTVVAIVFEVTELRRSENAFKASEDRFRDVYENAPTGILVLDWDGNVLRCNPAFSKVLGYPEKELINRTYKHLIHPDDLYELQQFGTQLQDSSIATFECENRCLSKAGDVVWFRTVVSRLAAPAGKTPAVVAICSDITLQKRAEVALQASAQQLKLVTDSTGEGIWDWSIEDDVVRHNARWQSMLGVNDDYSEHAYKNFIDLVHSEDRTRVQNALTLALETDAPYEIEFRFVRQDGSILWVEDRGKVVERNTSNRPTRMVGSLLDITARKVAEEQQSHLLAELESSEAEIRRQKLLFQSVFQNAPDPIVICDLNERIININPAFADIFQQTLECLMGEDCSGLFKSTEDFNKLCQRAEDYNFHSDDVVVDFIRNDSESFPGRVSRSQLIDATGESIGFLYIIRDVSVQMAREQALRESHRLESLGRLSGAIAHDFNNMLTVISGNIQLLQIQDPENRSLDEALRAAEMGARLNKRLITFARQRKLEPVSIDLNALISSLLPLIQRTMGDNIDVKTELNACPAHVLIDESEMENALLNLALNSRDAMGRGGVLSIRTTSLADSAPDAADKTQGVHVVIEDNGCGMPPHVKSRAFEPFFTTKDVGKGTGLGLATIDGFVRQSGGRVSLCSEVGSGTTVDIFLPLSDAPPSDIAKAVVKESAINSRDRRLKILVVEDNPAVRQIAVNYLCILGHETFEASSGVEALTILDSHHFDLVLSDVIMPGEISGFELQSIIIARHPDTRIVLASGFPGDRQDTRATGSQILAKPYDLQTLSRAIYSAIHTPISTIM